MHVDSQQWARLGSLRDPVTNESAPLIIWASILRLLGVGEEIDASTIEHRTNAQLREVTWCFTGVTATRLLVVDASREAGTWDSDTDTGPDKELLEPSSLTAYAVPLRALTRVDVTSMRSTRATFHVDRDEFDFIYRIHLRSGEELLVPRSGEFSRQSEGRRAAETVGEKLISATR